MNKKVLYYFLGAVLVSSLAFGQINAKANAENEGALEENEVPEVEETAEQPETIELPEENEVDTQEPEGDGESIEVVEENPIEEESPAEETEDEQESPLNQNIFFELEVGEKMSVNSLSATKVNDNEAIG